MNRRAFISGGAIATAFVAPAANASIRDLMCAPSVGMTGGNLFSSAAGGVGLDPGDNGIPVPGLDPAAPRRLRLVNNRLGERLDIVYFENGSYNQDAIQEYSNFIRDWRNNQVKQSDPKLMDIVWRITQMLDLQDGAPLNLNSGYRSPESNATVGGARNSMHMFAKANDLSHPTRSPRQIQAAAMRIGAGGVGIYNTFCHVDSGRRRTWRG